MSKPIQTTASHEETDRHLDSMTDEEIAQLEAENIRLASELEQERAAAARKDELRALIARNAQLKEQKARAIEIATPEQRTSLLSRYPLFARCILHLSLPSPTVVSTGTRTRSKAHLIRILRHKQAFRHRSHR